MTLFTSVRNLSILQTEHHHGNEPDFIVQLFRTERTNVGQYFILRKSVTLNPGPLRLDSI
jgi:hypothetical protein